MKFTFKPSPNYRVAQSTTDIMKYLTVALGAVLLTSIIWYGVSYGLAMRVIMLTVCAVASALLTETAYFAFTKSKDILHDVTHSYGWVTAIIMVLMTRVDVSYYAMVICVAVAILFGKLLFGGFGQNIFNPAAFGEALIMNAFTSTGSEAVTAQVLSGATPMTSMATTGWGCNGPQILAEIKTYGGLFGMLMGNYPSVIGGSCALILIVAFIYLVYHRVIDVRLSVSYIVTLFVVALITGLTHGSGIEFALFNVLAGGGLFAAVFMVTDPVTTPVSIPGRYIFGICAACLTLILRWKASVPDGALLAILLMNMLVPAIDRACDGSQIKDAKKIRNVTCGVSAVVFIITAVIAVTL